MSKRDPRIDKLIDASPDFAKPILTHMRELVHRVCPEVEETLKWSHPTFMYKGIMCGMASFKQHCLFMFWNHELMFQHDKKATQAMIERLGRLTSISELPPDKILISYLKEAMRLKDEGVKPVKPKPKPKTELVIPDYLIVALKKNKQASVAFENFSYSHKKEYIQWITEAKREETRNHRLQTALQWLAEGKPRNWKYMNC